MSLVHKIDRNTARKKQTRSTWIELKYVVFSGRVKECKKKKKEEYV